MKAKIAFAMVGAAALTACGSVSDLRPAEGNSLPRAAYGDPQQPTAEDLLTPSAQSQPARSDEILRRSQTREEDEFDLPPEA